MLMMCWFYCIPLLKGIFFASGFLLILFSFFVLKRGIRRSRLILRQMAFFFIFTALLKILTVDVYLLRDKILCATDGFFDACNVRGFQLLQGGGLVILVLSSLALFALYPRFLQERSRNTQSSEEAHIRLWANSGMLLVILLIVWAVAPWVGYLTVGHVPQLFSDVPWQYLANITVPVLLFGFWKQEDCEEEGRGQHSWIARDTLWMAAILFLIAVAFSYASQDVLSGTK